MQTQLAGPVLVARDHAPDVLDPVAIARDLEPRLAREVAADEADRARIETHPAGDLGESDGVRRRRPDADRVPQAGHHRQQPFAVADAERDGRRSQRLEGQVIAETARVEVVVHALEDDVARAAAHRPQRGRADLPVVRDVAPGQPDPHRLPGRAAGRLDADDPLERRALVHPEEFTAGLRLGDLALLHERDAGEVLDPADLVRPDAGGSRASRDRTGCWRGRRRSARRGARSPAGVHRPARASPSPHPRTAPGTVATVAPRFRPGPAAIVGCPCPVATRVGCRLAGRGLTIGAHPPPTSPTQGARHGSLPHDPPRDRRRPRLRGVRGGPPRLDRPPGQPRL